MKSAKNFSLIIPFVLYLASFPRIAVSQVSPKELAPLLQGLKANPEYDSDRLGKRVPLMTSDDTVAPLIDLQVFAPPVVPSDGTSCSAVLLKHEFGDGSFNTPAIVSYTPPTDEACGEIGRWAAISLNLSVTATGTQYDRLSAIYLSHVEIWRSSSAEPTQTGTIWNTLKDVTHYTPLFATNGTLLMDFSNIIDPSILLDAPFEVLLTATFYAPTASFPTPRSSDLIIPLSNLSPSVNNFFAIDNDAGAATNVSLPDNTAEAYVEIYCSGNSEEEFWYTNTPDEFVDALPAGVIGKGPFREVQVWVDDLMAGVVWPSPVIFTGGITPANWRPLTAYGAYDQPRYYIDITPFIPILTSPGQHKITFRVLGQGNDPTINSNWYVSGSIHATLGSERTTGTITTHHIGDLQIETTGKATEGNVSVTTLVTASRQIQITAELKTDQGEKTYSFQQNLKYSNDARYADQGWVQWAKQKTEGTTMATHGGKVVLRDAFTYPLSIFSNYSLYSQENGSYGSEVNQTFTRAFLTPNARPSIVHSVQHSRGHVNMDNWPVLRHAISGSGATDQIFAYDDGLGHTYFRDIAAKNDGWVKDRVWGTLAASNPPVPDEQIYGPQGGPGFRRMVTRENGMDSK